MVRRILVTGGCGFIGHHFVEHLLKNTDWDIVVIDALSYASRGFDRLREIEAYDDRRVHRLSANFNNPIRDGLAEEIGQVDYIVHMGAETHVDNSIKNPEPFVVTNVVGTMRVLDFALLQKNLKCFFYFSTDEVFGPAPGTTKYSEWDPYNCTNPYAASKAGGEELTLAYANTYNLPAIVTHTMNVFGERQHPEKFIPLCIRKILAGETIYVHSDPTRTIPGSRHWVHARNVAEAMLHIMKLIKEEPSAYFRTSLPGLVRDKVNIVGEREVNNLQMARSIANILGREANIQMVDFHSSRPGHDLRYALDGEFLEELGYVHPKTFEDSLRKTVEWTVQHSEWLQVDKLQN